MTKGAMVNYQDFRRIAKEKGIPEIYVKREYWEMIILSELLESNFAPSLILKGGLALRLRHGSPRLSDDIDLGMTNGIGFDEFGKVVKKIASKHGLEITDLWEKHFTFMGEFKVRGARPSENFRIKIELSKRDDVKERERGVAVISSDVVPSLKLVGEVLSIESLYEDKVRCVKTRKKPRDLFDLWYLSQTLNRQYEPARIAPGEEAAIRRELKMYLPARLHKVIAGLYAIGDDKEPTESDDETQGYYPADWTPGR